MSSSPKATKRRTALRSVSRNGDVLIPAGSKQSVKLSVSGPRNLESAAPDVRLISESQALSDTFFAFGGWAAPRLLYSLLTESNGGNLTRDLIRPRGRLSKLGSNIVFDFRGNQLATFYEFAVYNKSGLGVQIKEFELLVGDAPGGPFRSLGEFHVPKDDDKKVNFAETRAKYFVVRPIST